MWPWPWETAGCGSLPHSLRSGPRRQTQVCVQPPSGRSISLICKRPRRKPEGKKAIHCGLLRRPQGKMELCHPAHVSRAQAFGPLRAFKLNGLALVEGFVAVFLNGGKVDEDIFAARPLNEPVTFGSIEPLHYTLLLHSPSSRLAQRGLRSQARFETCRRRLSGSRHAASRLSARDACAQAARFVTE